MPKPFEGRIGRTFEDSSAWWPPLPKSPEGAPNVVIVVLDDVVWVSKPVAGGEPRTTRGASGEEACVLVSANVSSCARSEVGNSHQSRSGIPVSR